MKIFNCLGATALLVTALSASLPASAEAPFEVEVIDTFQEPWALSEMPDGRFLLSEKKGTLLIINEAGERSLRVAGVPQVVFWGQGGFGDVQVHPDFENNGLVYMSYVEAGVGDTRGAAVARGRLDESGRRPALQDVEVIWRQYPKQVGYGHYGHRIAFDDDGYLWISSGDRQKFTPSQDMQSNIGKILRLNDDGSIPEDNPFVDYYETDAFVDDEGVYPQIWSLGHRNPLGMDFDLDGRLWEIEMGPAGGDELNLIERGENYGYPVVSNGEHYDERPIPDHDTRPEFAEPAIWWTPVISPGDLMVYRGDAFPEWKGNALVAGLSSRAIIRIQLNDDGSAEELERFPMDYRIRSLAQDADGNVWVVEDDGGREGGRLLRLTPR